MVIPLRIPLRIAFGRPLWTPRRAWCRTALAYQLQVALPRSIHCTVTTSHSSQTTTTSANGKTSTTTTPCSSVRLRKYRLSEGPTGRQTLEFCPTLQTWRPVPPSSSSSTKDTPASSPPLSFRSSLNDIPAWFHRHVVVHFLPARYPYSVASGYASYAQYSFVASVAGSASLVLSTQTLLLAVGVVGSSSPASASVLAGAWNWVLKDGMGQLGGVLFASRVGQSQWLDVYPKQARLVSAVCLDLANGMELLTPLLILSPTTASTGAAAAGFGLTSSQGVLIVASLANVLKNIGFLTASASRAALHQALTTTTTTTATSSSNHAGGGSHNLADVTAKAGTQAMAAGLLGTAVGLAVSASLLAVGSTATEHYYSYLAACGMLSLVHQGCTYASVQQVPLPFWNRPRLEQVLQHIMVQQQQHQRDNHHHGTPTNVEVWSPTQVAHREPLWQGVWWWSSSLSSCWLTIGSPFVDGRNSETQKEEEWSKLIQDPWCQTDGYLLQLQRDDTHDKTATKIHLTFWDHVTGPGMILGVWHAHLLHQLVLLSTITDASTTNNNNTNQTTTTTPNQQDQALLEESYRMVQGQRDHVLQEMNRVGWRMDVSSISVEPAHAVRLAWVQVEQEKEDTTNTTNNK